MNTMADFRCGRRKQANPRKKNVDEESGDQATDLKASEESGEEGNNDEKLEQEHTDELLPRDRQSPEAAPPVQPDSTQDTPVAQEGTENMPSMDAASTDPEGRPDQPPAEGPASPPHTSDELADELSESPDQITAEYGDEFMLRCNFCSKGFQRMAQLREHSREVHGEDISPFQCSKCHASYAVKSQLEKHMAFHSPTSQVCKICHKTFANVYRLQRHMLSHSESSDLRKFKCLECGKAFKFKHHLKEHIRIHSGEKPFSCSNCGKRFSHSGSYSSHMTSKKCWVVNMKGRPGQPQAASEEQMRALAPKLDQNGMDMSMTTAYANAYQAAMAQAYHMGFDQRLAPPFLGINGIRPFLPFPPFGNLPNPLVPNVSTAGPAFTFPPTTTTDTAINNENLEVLSKVAAQQALLPEKNCDKEQNERKSPGLDFNQNNKGPVTSQINCRQHTEDQCEGTKESPRPAAGESEDSESDSEDSDSDDSSSEHTDSRSSGQHDDLSSVRKILAVVEATVAKQRQNQPDKATISKLVQMSLREHAKEDPMTLAGRARQVLQEHLKHVKPTNGENTSDNGSDRASGNEDQGEQVVSESKKLVKCKYCPLEFSSPVQLHQHESYLCKSNEHIPKVPIVVPTVKHPSGYQRDKNGLNWDPYCKHCRTKFDSPIELHQHERYLCSENREIRGLGGGSDFVKMENGSLSNGINESSRASDGGSGDFRNEQRIRSRSNISEEQLQILKSHYKQNPRPTRDELQMLAVQLGFPKRVVQVWFQNRRAQEKRVGRLQTGYHENLPSAALDWEKSTKNGAAYIPVVPQFQPSSQSQSMVCYPLPQSNVSVSTSNGQYANSNSSGTKPLSTPTFSNQMEPLDLSTKKKDGQSCIGCPSVSNLDSPESEENGVLNLSKRKTDDSQTSFEESVMYKYLHKDKDGEVCRDRSYLSPRSLSSPEAHQLHIDPKAASTPAHLSSPSGYLSPSPSDLTSPRSSLESSFNSSLDSAGLDQAAVRAKRARRKSWRQVGPDVEAEETQLELGEDALTVDEEFPLRKKRKCWKYHKLEASADEGMYSCDQCDKLFSKQSSLARHKYEHSGQRPFNCDICCKAFKHKHHLTEHKRLHSGEKPFQCKKCGKRFSHSGSFSQHMNHRYKYCKPLRLDDAF